MLSHNNINFIPLKGPILSFDLYQSYTKKAFIDIDILVQKKDLDACFQLLKELNFELKNPKFSSQKQKNFILKHLYHYTFYRKDDDCYIELHWNLFANQNITKEFQKEVWINYEIKQYQNFPLYKMKAEYEFLYLIVHACQHLHQRLFWLIDIYFYIKKHDEQFLLEVYLLSKRFNLEQHYLSTLLLMSEIMEFDLPKCFEKKIDARTINLKNIFVENILLSTKKRKNKAVKRAFLYLKSVYLLYGFNSFFYEIKSRNRKPENWESFVFPDKLFFLNQLFSRPIWLYRKILRKN
ncbi:MAG: nucleotidyltransferase family protein [Flavobacteriia bacterium]|nr:nucleotidyltransferase family protein [Flavobacteriia bacterium]